jgi:hypothetical protein
MQTTNKGRLFGISLSAFMLILALVLASAGAIAVYYLDLSIPSIFSANQPEMSTSIQPSNLSVSISVPQVSVQPAILVENKEWARHYPTRQVPFQKNTLVENKKWARHYPTKQVPFQTHILVENKEWSR